MKALDPAPRLPLADRAADRAGVSKVEVEAIMAAHGVPSAPVPAAPRSLRVLRLRVNGVKAGIPDDGPFDTVLMFPTGVVMAVAPNLRGKTSMLEILCWCLRGSARELQPDVKSWLTRVECDVLINDAPVAIRLDLSGGSITVATVLQTDTIEDLQTAVPGGSGTRLLVTAASDGEYEAAMEALMLDRLGLEVITNIAGTAGTVQTHAWPTYFGAVYPPAGGEKVLIGETAMGGLAGRLLQVFLDLPGAAVLTRLKTAASVLGSADSAAAAEARAAWAQLSSARLLQEQRLTTAHGVLDALAASSGAGPSASETAGLVTSLSSLLADAVADLRGDEAAHAQARQARVNDQRRLNDASEAAAAGRLFHGLDPQTCPRCETPVSKERRAVEVSGHQCAVCTSPVSAGTDDEEDQALQAELRLALEATSRVEEQAARAAERARLEVSETERRLAAAEEVLRAALDASAVKERVAAEREVAQAEGALQVLPVPAAEPPVAPDDVQRRILEALSAELETDLKQASTALFDELGREIASLAIRFGMTSVQEITVDRRSVMKIRKGGAVASSFSAQSPGERLRLRIATVAALLRVGSHRGVGTHPGLLLLDSLRAEEIQDVDAHALLDELVAIAADTPGLQVITTTQDVGLPLGRLPIESVLGPPIGGDALW
jgi:hypothetical protein